MVNEATSICGALNSKKYQLDITEYIGNLFGSDYEVVNDDVSACVPVNATASNATEQVQTVTMEATKK